MAGSKKALHFFPGPKVILWVVDGAVVLQSEAWGGEKADPKKHYDVMKPRQTTPGNYVVYSYGPYKTNSWSLSKITWGTRLSLDATGNAVLFETRGGRKPWARVEERIPGATKSFIQGEYYKLYGLSGKYDSDGDLVPDLWVFNDFGAYAVMYFKDLNHNRKLDRGTEKLSGEMMHTTPDNEAQVALGEDVVFAPSHGCVHLNQLDRDKFYTAGAFDRGIDLVVHKYSEEVPASF